MPSSSRWCKGISAEGELVGSERAKQVGVKRDAMGVWFPGF